MQPLGSVIHSTWKPSLQGGHTLPSWTTTHAAASCTQHYREHPAWHAPPLTPLAAPHASQVCSCQAKWGAAQRSLHFAAPVCSVGAKVVLCIANVDHFTSQEPKPGISCTLHPNHLLRKDCVRCRTRGTIVFLYQRADKLPSGSGGLKLEWGLVAPTFSAISDEMLHMLLGVWTLLHHLFSLRKAQEFAKS